MIVERNHHWGSRWGTDRNRALWSAFTVRLPGGNIFFAGDTGWGDGSWAREAARHGPFRLAIMPIGAYEPRDVMRTSHVDPEEAVRDLRGARTRRARSACTGAPSSSPSKADRSAAAAARRAARARGIAAGPLRRDRGRAELQRSGALRRHDELQRAGPDPVAQRRLQGQRLAVGGDGQSGAVRR